MAKLVIVESPAKAKTIRQWLGPDYQVEATYGHVRDLPESAAEIPPDLKKQKWARLGVDVESGFVPLYVVPASKKRYVEQLRKAAKGAESILLATDEDREGESISWHVLELLKPSRKTAVQRIVFHELTPEAIRHAVAHPRQLDEDLVKAQETRRILDRLYGYTLSPLLWKKVGPRLSAGRVQSVAVRLVVQRERERMAFREAEYWDLLAVLEASGAPFEARLVRIGDRSLATGQSFDPTTGLLSDESKLWLKEADARALAEKCREARPWRVESLEEKPGLEKPPPPFMTSTLQQEANRKLGFSAKRTMQIAQVLYEGVDVGGDRKGLITYMRTDSLQLAASAVRQARELIRETFGAEYLPSKAPVYRTRTRNAQEAHEAIRPTDFRLTPERVKPYLDPDQFALYELIWKRAVASQMTPARVRRTAVEVRVDVDEGPLSFGAKGKIIEFPGFLSVYVEDSDDPESELAAREKVLPPLSVGQAVDPISVEADGHRTRPPARYTEASLVGKLETEGVGRPSTYATILSTIQERGYVFKRGKEIVPTFTAMAVVELLENHFSDLVDIGFTARLEDELDEIATGRLDPVEHLRRFYLGSEQHDGLAPQVDKKAAAIPFPSLELGVDPSTGLPVRVRVGRFGTYVQRGEGGSGHTASVPPDMAPEELTLERALALIEGRNGSEEPLAVDPETGRKVYLRQGRFGPYLALEQTEAEREAGAKPTWVTVPSGLTREELDPETVTGLLRLPRELGRDPETGEPVVAGVGRYGAYVKRGKETRDLEPWRRVFEVDMEEALRMLAQPKARRSRRAAAPEPVKVLSSDDDEPRSLRVMKGRYGPYVTDGEVNATLPRGVNPDELTFRQAVELIEERKRNGRSAARPVPGRRRALALSGRSK